MYIGLLNLLKGKHFYTNGMVLDYYVKNCLYWIFDAVEHPECFSECNSSFN